MDKSVFDYHVDDSKNDFYNWIKFVFNNSKLADNIEYIRDKNKMANIIKKFI